MHSGECIVENAYWRMHIGEKDWLQLKEPCSESIRMKKWRRRRRMMY
jgi:hypothetical protein